VEFLISHGVYSQTHLLAMMYCGEMCSWRVFLVDTTTTTATTATATIEATAAKSGTPSLPATEGTAATSTTAAMQERHASQYYCKMGVDLLSVFCKVVSKVSTQSCTLLRQIVHAHREMCRGGARACRTMITSLLFSSICANNNLVTHLSGAGPESILEY
jgi:hypothetical protein